MESGEPIANKTFAELAVQDFAAFGEELGIPLKLVEGELKLMTRAILRAAQKASHRI